MSKCININICGTEEKFQFSNTLFTDFPKESISSKALVELPFLLNSEDNVAEESSQPNSVFTAELSIVGPVLFFKVFQAKKINFNILLPTYMPLKMKTRHIWLIPLPDLLKDIIKITFNTEENRDSWFSSLISARGTMPKPLFEPQIEVSSSTIINVKEDQINLLSFRGDLIETIDYNTNLIICSAFFRDEVPNPYGLVVSNKINNQFNFQFSDFDGLIAIYCSINYYLNIKNIQTPERPHIYKRNTKIDGITTDFTFDCFSMMKEPVIHQIFSTKPSEISYGSLIPRPATSDINIFDFGKTIHRTILYHDYMQAPIIRQPSMIQQAAKLKHKTRDEIYKEEIDNVFSKLENSCYIESNSWNFDNLFDSKSIFPQFSDTIYKKSDSYSSEFHNILLSIDYKLDDEKFNINDVIQKIEKFIVEIENNHSKEVLFKLLHALGSVLVAGTKEIMFKEYIIFYLSSSKFSKDVPDQDRLFEEFIIIILYRFLINKKLSQFFDDIFFNKSFSENVFTEFSIFTVPEFFSDLQKRINRLETIPKFDLLQIPQKLSSFETYNSYLYGRVVEIQVKKIILDFMEMKESESFHILFIKLFSTLIKFFCDKFYIIGENTSIWNSVKGFDSTQFPYPQAMALSDSIKKIDELNQYDVCKFANLILEGLKQKMVDYWILLLSKYSKLQNIHREDAPIYHRSQLTTICFELRRLYDFTEEIDNSFISQYSYLF